MLHVKKDKIDLSRKTVQRILQKLKFEFIFIYLLRGVYLKVTLNKRIILVLRLEVLEMTQPFLIYCWLRRIKA